MGNEEEILTIITVSYLTSCRRGSSTDARLFKLFRALGAVGVVAGWVRADGETGVIGEEGIYAWERWVLTVLLRATLPACAYGFALWGD
jgi:hypothetical protein